MSDSAEQVDWIGSPYRDLVSTQSYEKSQINDVRLVELKLFSDEGGDFCEITQLQENGSFAEFADFSPAQINYSVMEPGAVKAWHLHARQDDLWFAPPASRLLVGLLDVRDGSETYQRSMRLTMGAGRPQCLFIPKGVAHGVANLGLVPATILYFVSRVFDAAEPDELRLPYDLLGADFWQIQPG